jgi:hypothetical protein
MGKLTKADVFQYADYYYRNASKGLTMEELWVNFRRYNNEPRDIKQVRGVMQAQPTNLDLAVLKDVLTFTCTLMEVRIVDVNSKKRDANLVIVRQMVVFVAFRMGYRPADIALGLGWDRSISYQRARRAEELASIYPNQRANLNHVLRRFGCDEFIA